MQSTAYHTALFCKKASVTNALSFNTNPRYDKRAFFNTNPRYDKRAFFNTNPRYCARALKAQKSCSF